MLFLYTTLLRKDTKNRNHMQTTLSYLKTKTSSRNSTNPLQMKQKAITFGIPLLGISPHRNTSRTTLTNCLLGRPSWESAENARRPLNKFPNADTLEKSLRTKSRLAVFSKGLLLCI